MFKAFSRLWLVVFAPLLFLLVPHAYSPISLINEHAEKTRYVMTYEGTFHLIQMRLSQQPQAQWPKIIEQLSVEFGYKLELVPLDSPTLSSAIKKQLVADEFAFSNGEPELLIYRVEDSPWAISLALDITEEEDFVRASSGTLFLIKSEFENADKAQWPEVIEALSPQFHFQLSILPIEQLTLADEQVDKLTKRQLVWEPQKSGELSFYYLLDDKKSVLLAGPLPVTVASPAFILALLFIFVLAISIGMFLWVSPLWRDLNKLASTAEDFGDGYLEKRATLAKTSVIARLGRSFNNMADRIEKLISNHRELTNAIAHDLRTPLYRLRFAFEMLSSSDLTEESRQRYFRSISSSIDDVDYLIDQILVLSRYSRAVDITHFSECHLAESIRNEIEHHREENTTFRYEFVLSKELQVSRLFVDRKALLRALNNLLSNAKRFARSHIRVSLITSDDTYVLRIEDDGPGIKLDDRETIFQPFSQLENKQRDLTNGHGLGLTIVQQIALWHKGNARVTDSSLGGALFEIRWPNTIQ